MESDGFYTLLLPKSTYGEAHPKVYQRKKNHLRASVEKKQMEIPKVNVQIPDLNSVNTLKSHEDFFS